MKFVRNLLKIKTFLAIIILISVCSSCNDWIDIEPENALIKQEFWKTKSDLMSVLASAYDATRGTTEKSFNLGEVRADFISNDANDYYDIGINNISTTNGAVKWADYYKAINLANTVKYYAPIVSETDLTLTPEIVGEIDAEMVFLRSLNYFYLVRIWKDVPLVLNPTISDTVNFFTPKSNEAVVLKQIVSDLKNAIPRASQDATEKGRANKYAIQALLADVLLWNENYTECINYCDAIINSGLFGLEPIATWFSLYYPGNSQIESIFEIQYNDKLDQQENPIYFSTSTYTNYLDRMGFDQVIDIRYCGGKGPFWKITGKDETGSNSKRRTSNQYDANFIYYRYADILFIKAEALAELGNFDEANKLVQDIAERAGAIYTPMYSLNVFRSSLLAERGREFGAEGKRWFDVLRFAKKGNFKDTKFLKDMMLSKARDAQELAVIKTKVVDTMSYYLPIHEDELKFNRNLVQNPFYDR